MVFKIKHSDKKTSARIGILETRSGKVETPFFMPVATKMTVKQLSTLDLKEIGVPAVISNTLVLHFRPGEKFIKQMGGIKKFMNFNGVNVTDSGGFQMYSPSLYLKSDKDGVFFKNPYTNQKTYLTPEKNMDVQLDIGSDIAMCLDTMPLIENSKKEIEHAVEKTFAWGKRCKAHHSRMQEKIPKKKRQLLFGITQGGIHADLRQKSAKLIKEIDFDGYAIGGLALGEEHADEFKMIKVHKKIIPENKICYLMGVGNPVELVTAISLGVDMFDSRFPTMNARRGTLFTSKGKLRIFRKENKESSEPIDENCKCMVCKNYSRGYLRHLMYEEESTGLRLATYHNIFYLTNLMQECKKHIRAGSFKKFRDDLIKIYKKSDEMKGKNKRSKRKKL